MNEVARQLHRLVEDLPESERLIALRFLEYLRDRGSDPLLRKLRNAPIDDEPVTADEEAAIAEAIEDEKAGRIVSHEDVRREFDL